MKKVIIAFCSLFLIFNCIQNIVFASQKPLVKSPQVILIESKGLAEFNAENDTINDVSLQDKQMAEEILPILHISNEDIAKNKEVISALGKIIGKYPEYSDAYFIRAGLFVLVGDKDYRKILADIDNAIKFHSSLKYKSAYDSTAEMYGLRAKVDILSSDYQQAVKDLETAIRINPDNASRVFNSGGVKPEEETNPTSLQKKDLDLLIKKYSNNYRTYMFRGLFYFFFTSFNISREYYALADKDLKEALKINPRSALVNYLLGKVTQRMSFWSEAAAKDVSDITDAKGGFKEKTNEIALYYFKKAIEFDSTFTDAYAEVATSLLSLKRYSEAIPYYDKVIKLSPDNAAMYNDRGLAKTNINKHNAAFSDFSKAIELKRSKNLPYLDNSYENRAATYVKINDYRNAIDDYSNAIGLELASRILLMSISQIRAIYPEFENISDQDLLEGFRQKYYSNLSPEDFSSQYSKDKKPFEDFILAELYGKRGDAYMSLGNYKKAAAEYDRAIHDWSGYILDDRWKVISNNSKFEHAVDFQTLDFTKGNIVSLWLKDLNLKTQDYGIVNYQINCANSKIKLESKTFYNSSGNVIYTSPSQYWENIVPESIGETLYRGMCK